MHRLAERSLSRTLLAAGAGVLLYVAGVETGLVSEAAKPFAVKCVIGASAFVLIWTVSRAFFAPGSPEGRCLPVRPVVARQLLILFVLLSAHSVFVSHRIAGPLYRFRTVMKSVASGDLSIRFTLRKKDYLVREADLFAEMIAALREKVGSVKDHCSELEALVEELRIAADGDSTDEIQPRLQRLRAEMAKLKAAADELTTDHASPHDETQETEAPIGSARVPNEA